MLKQRMAFRMPCFSLPGKKSSGATKTQIKVQTTIKDSDSESYISDPDQDLVTEGPNKLFTKTLNLEDKLVAVIVTISEGSSYDLNFQSIEPTTVPGERISTYSMECSDVGKLHDFLTGAQPVPAAPSTWAELIEDIRTVPADSVTLNWECCSGCGDSGFPLCSCSTPWSGRRRRAATRAPSATMKLMGLSMRRGFTVMCSDFSLKALISEWSEEQLGPNPFLKFEQECSNQFQLDFVPSDLLNEEVPQQLQVVGELCGQQGRAIVAALGGTIVYTVNPCRTQTELYDLKVLTVVSTCSGAGPMPEAMQCSVGTGEGEKRGAAGHVTLTYASGGQIVTSMGHWIELTRIDTSLEHVLQAAARHFGQGEYLMVQSEMNELNTDAERRECVQKWSKSMVQKSVPTRMKARTKY